MKKVWFMTLAVAAMMSTPSLAQQEAEPAGGVAATDVRNELSVWGLGGASSFLYSPNAGAATLGYGGGGGIGVGRFFNPSFGLRFGVELMTYATEFKAPSFSTEYVEKDNNDGTDFFFRTGFYNYREKQKAMMLNLPIMACYERGWLYAQLGLKLGLSLSDTYNATADSIVMKAFDTYSEALYSNIPEQGFTTYPNAAHSGSLKLGLNIALSAEVGAKWKLSSKLSLYTGIYADYGLLNVVSKGERLIDYVPRDAPAGEHTYSSVLSSALSATVGEQLFTNRVGMVSAGIKIALGINTTTLFAAAKKEGAGDAYSDSRSSYAAPQDDRAEPEKKQPLKAEQEENERTAKEQEKADRQKAKEEKEQEKAQAKAQEKAEKQAAKERGKLTPRQQQMEDDIVELKRVQEVLMQQAESSSKNQEAILGAVKAAQDAATAAAEAARAAQTAVMNMQGKDMQGKNNAAERKALTAARKDASNLSFKIQVAARRTPLDNIDEPFARFNLDMKISEERYPDESAQGYIYKYVVGAYRSVDAAVEACNEVRSKGIADAFVVAYHRGKRISMAEAFNLLNRQ
jgi:outer membrane biosynthesis protein TonB